MLSQKWYIRDISIRIQWKLWDKYIGSVLNWQIFSPLSFDDTYNNGAYTIDGKLDPIESLFWKVCPDHAEVKTYLQVLRTELES